MGYANAQGRRSLKQAKPAVTQTYTQTVLHQFGSAQLDGVYPSGGLIKDNDGNFYGATSNGGQIGLGSVFEFTPSSSGGTYNAIYSSQYGPCDYYISFLSIDSLGNLYGTCDFFHGGVFEISKGSDGNWIESNAYGFTGVYDGAVPSSPVVVDSAGNVYSTTLNHGAYDVGTIDELALADSQWLENTLLAFGGGGVTAAGPDALIMDSAGDLYGTAGGQTLSNQGVLFKLHHTAKGWVYSVIHAFQGGPNDGGWPMGNLTFDAAGNIYGTAGEGLQASGECCGGVYKITKSGKISWLYVFQGGADGALPASGVVFDKNGNLYGTTYEGGGGNPDYCGTGIGYGCGVVFKLTPPSSESSTAAWTESVLHTFTGGTDGDFAAGPLVLDDAGNIYGTTDGGGNGWGIGGYGVLYELTPDPVATTSTITKISPNPAAVGQPVAVSFSVVGLNPTGIVTIQASTGEECVAPVQPNGTGHCVLEFAAAGTKTVTASYAGDTENQASTSAGVPIQVENVTTTTITKNVPNPAKVGQTVTLRFDVAVNAGATRKTLPTGSITVNASTGESCTGTLALNGSGKCELVFSSSGSRTLVATYAGDADNEGSVSIAVAETVN
ncbi:MAG: Ig-like domain-containing protein [Terriglobales bacterium]